MIIIIYIITYFLKGLDIATNKVTVEEAQGITHHLINVIEVTDTNFNGLIFVQLAIPIVNSSH